MGLLGSFRRNRQNEKKNAEADAEIRRNYRRRNIRVSLDISETNEDLVVRVELPGFDKDEISVKATENSLDISAEHKEKKVEKTEKMYKAEMRHGGVRRFVTLPTEIKLDKVDTSFENCLLTIKLKKAKPAKKSKEIKIK